MGSSLSDQEWEAKMEGYELEILKLSGLDVDKVNRTYTMIEMEGSPFRVRTIYIGDKTKKTLLITHGYFSNGTTYLKMLKPLSEKYRLVLFDNCGWGLNTKP